MSKVYLWGLGLAILTLALSACNLSRNPEGVEPLGTSKPDVAIFMVSGRCGVPCSSAPDGNWDYLGPRGTGEAIAQAFRELGRSAVVYSYSAHLYDHYSPISQKTEKGFLSLEAQYNWVYQNWVQGQANPTRIVLVGHSHGTNWTHNLTRIYRTRPFSYVIDLDGICFLWEDDNRPYFQDYYARYGNPWGVDISKSCDVEPIRFWYGTSYYSAKDVAYPSVVYNLEVQSKRVISGLSAQGISPQGQSNFAFDYTDNRRLDGSRTRIYTYVSTSEDHGQVTYPTSQAIAWVKGQIKRLGLP